MVVRRVVLPALSRPSRRMEYSSLDVAQKYTLLARWYILAGGSVLWEVCAGAAA